MTSPPVRTTHIELGRYSGLSEFGFGAASRVTAAAAVLDRGVDADVGLEVDGVVVSGAGDVNVDADADADTDTDEDVDSETDGDSVVENTV